jgi:hypothetical protein
MHKHIHCRDTFDVGGVNGVFRFCYALVKRFLKTSDYTRYCQTSD